MTKPMPLIERADSQVAALLLTRCISRRVAYLIRTTPLHLLPRDTWSQWGRDLLITLLTSCDIRMPTCRTEQARVWEQASLPTSLGGIGITDPLIEGVYGSSVDGLASALACPLAGSWTVPLAGRLAGSLPCFLADPLAILPASLLARWCNGEEEEKGGGWGVNGASVPLQPRLPIPPLPPPTAPVEAVRSKWRGGGKRAGAGAYAPVVGRVLARGVRAPAAGRALVRGVRALAAGCALARGARSYCRSRAGWQCGRATSAELEGGARATSAGRALACGSCHRACCRAR
ncbi:unnamed protein product [Closterium sp. Naga37s-1]|nr:unnamed protein product [Closterium sp. Naga37s-1]